MNDQDSVSIIESPREAEVREAEEKAKRLAAAEEAANREIRTAESRKKTLRAMFLVFGGIIGAALLVALVWLVITVVSSIRTPAGDDVGGGDEPPAAELPVIAGYQCTTEQCNKVTDLPDGRILMRDTAYYMYDSDEKTTVKTTIPEKIYHAIIPFVWGSETLAVLDPDTGRSALYSITRNQQVGEFSYDSFITDAKAAEYKGMEWTIGKYIIAKQDTAVRFLDLFDGVEVVRAQNRVFAYSVFFFGYDAEGMRRAYTAGGTRIVSAPKGDYLFVKDKRLIHVKAASLASMDIYSETGEKLKTNDEYYANLRKALSGQRNFATAIAGMAGTYRLAD